MSPRPPAAKRLDRDQILAGALAIADRDGVDAVSLRKIAAEFGVTPMALYWHFKDKEALLDALVAQLLADVDPAASAGIRTIANALLRALRAHPALAEMAPLRFMRTDAGLAISERIVGLLRAGGHSPLAAVQLSTMVLNSLCTLVTSRPGYTSVHDPQVRSTLLTAKRGRLRSLPPDEFPQLTEVADFFLELADEDDYYRRGLDYVLAGLEV